MDISDIAIEPAATLIDAQGALERHQPRIVVFSGHTLMGSLVFEDGKGRLDEHADPTAFAEMLRARVPVPVPSTPRTPRLGEPVKMLRRASQGLITMVNSGMKTPTRNGSSAMRMPQRIRSDAPQSSFMMHNSEVQQPRSDVQRTETQFSETQHSEVQREEQFEVLRNHSRAVDAIKSRDDALRYLKRLSTEASSPNRGALIVPMDDDCVPRAGSTWANFVKAK
eukprot:3291699-Prymnesium_polylepis.1